MEASEDGNVIRLEHWDLQDNDEEDDNDDSFVPDSLKGFLEEANRKMEQDLAQILSPDEDVEPVETQPPNLVRDEQEDVVHMDSDNDNTMDDSFLSPPDIIPTVNPAAHLTFGAAKGMAMHHEEDDDMDGEMGDPVVVNLQQQLEQAVDPSSSHDDSNAPPQVIPTPSKASPPSSFAPSPHRGPVQTLRDQVRGKMSVPSPTPPGTHSLAPDPPGHPGPRMSLGQNPTILQQQQQQQPPLSQVSIAAAEGVLSTPSKETSPISFPQTLVNSPPPSSASKSSSHKKVTSPTPTKTSTSTPAKAKTPASRSKTQSTPMSTNKNKNDNNNHSSNKENPVSIEKHLVTAANTTPVGAKNEPSSRKPLSQATSPSPKPVGTPAARPSIGSYQTPPPSIPQSQKRQQTTPLSSSDRPRTSASKPQEPAPVSPPLRPSPEDRPQGISIRQRSPHPGVALSPAGLSLDVTPIHPTSATPASSSAAKRRPRSSARKAMNAMASPNKSTISTTITSNTPDHWKGRKPLTSPGVLSPRILQETVASKARLSQEQEQQQLQQAKAREMRSPPGVVSPRLLRETAASKARVVHEAPKSPQAVSPPSKAPMQPVSSRLLQPTETMIRHHPEQLKEVQEAAREQEKKEAERQQAMDARENNRKRQLLEKKQKMQTIMARARSRRERLEEIEKERIAKLKAKVEEKEEKARRRKLEKENNRPKSTTRHTNKLVSPPPRSRASSKPAPTIPVTPKFQTDRRLKAKHAANPPKDPVPLAQSDNVLKQCLRSEGKPPTPDVRASQGATPRVLTIPRGPKLSTSKRHRTTPTPAADSIEARSSWETELRHPSSPVASDRSTSSRLTIPQTPHFQEIRHRAKPKSTAEKEKEVMDYYKAHPFKARPVMMNDLGPPSARPPPPSRPLTTPSPFHFQMDQRLGPSSTSKAKNETPTEDTTRVRLFSDRPHASKEETPRPSAPRGLTVPQPFQFHSSEHRKERTSPQEERSSSTFRARPMPDFSRHTGLTMVQKTESRHSRDPPVERKGSRLRQRPLSTSVSRRSHAASRQRPSEEETPKFRARPMPNFDNVAIPVVAKKPSPPSQKSSRGQSDAGENGHFHARGVPDFSKPSIPVKYRDPSKLRSPEDVQRIQSKLPKEQVHQFKALPAPTTTDPELPVRKKCPIKVDRDKLRRRSLAARTKPDPSSGVSSFVARSAPIKSPPTFPVRSKDPSKLRGPKEVSKLGGPRRVQGSRGSEKEAMKARVRERMMGRKSGAHATAPNDSEGRYFSQPTSTTLKMALANSSSPKPSLPETGLVTAPVTSPQLSPTSGSLEGAPAGAPDTCAVELFPPEPNAQTVGTPEPKQDAGAQYAGNSSAGLKRSPDPPGTAVDDRNLYSETMQLAAQLQRAAEEELSFHGSSALSWKQ
eukprot:Nitzschia sp. Nitz4//scaffold225_size51843//5232//9440//NITZ4_006891-RA/size51843-processed-gene-0.57-mRNA-1//1//CDS//3329542663//8952//frame0